MADAMETPTFNATTGFARWLKDAGISIGFTTYQSGKVFLLGHNPQDELSIFERTIERAMGLWSDGESMVLGGAYQLYLFSNNLTPGQAWEGYDALYAPRMAWYTGDVDSHDVYLDRSRGIPVFVNTLFSCIAAVSSTHSFEPLWQPRFVSALGPDDRCHLNGLALRDGSPVYATAVATTDHAEGWREHRSDGGVVIDISSGEIICQGLSMPHSPRWHDGRLWVANAGTGEFGIVDPTTGSFEPVAFCPGYIRGVALHGRHAVVGLSKPRGNKTFEGLPLHDRLARKDAAACCGLRVISLDTGEIVQSLDIEGVVEELYDVAVLPGVRRPSLVGFRNDEVRRLLHVGPRGTLS